MSHKQLRTLVCGAGGFIGGHLVKALRAEGHFVRGVDVKEHEFGMGEEASEFIVGDLRDPTVVARVFTHDIDEVYQLAADMGGAEFVFTGENDADIMHNSALVNLNVLHRADALGTKPLIFYSSSACMYPERNQMDPQNPNCTEDSAYPAAPDSEYGWEKLFSERLYLAFARNKGLRVRIARFHNVFGPFGTWKGGREKAPAALCRKVAAAADDGVIDVFGDGLQTRSFLYVDECVEGILRLMRNPTFTGPVNIGSEEMISINDLALLVATTAGKSVRLNNIPGPVGVRGRNSDNTLIRSALGWEPSKPLCEGIAGTLAWVTEQCSVHGSQ